MALSGERLSFCNTFPAWPCAYDSHSLLCTIPHDLFRIDLNTRIVADDLVSSILMWSCSGKIAQVAR